MARTLSPVAHEAIVEAFVSLLETHAVDVISMEAIAQKAGASKATIYKHWKDKQALLIEVIGRMIAAQPAADSGDHRADVLTMLRHIFVPERRDAYDRAWPAIYSYTFTHPEMGRAVCQDLMAEMPEKTLFGVLAAGVKSGRLRRDLDSDLAVDLLVGPLMHHLYLHGSVPATLPEQVVDAVWPTLLAG